VGGVTGRVEGRRCLVTGAAQGLGRTFCAALAAEGAAIAGLDIADLDGTATEVQAAGGTFAAIQADITRPDEVAPAISEAVERLGGLDILVNNAGIYPLVPFEQTTYDLWRRVMSVNLDGLFLVTSAALPHLRKSRAARIVNIASAAVWLGPPGMVAYTASKAGVIGFTRALASELGPTGITVNAMTPGMIPTKTAIDTGVTVDLERVVSGQAIARAEQPEDLISTLLFLVDEGSSFVTGSAINVDGGFAKH
jgi:NAD(P)-dependent dehydrogenase (short-subunit alcohol dehydrogenase family)